jgi:hypothetical protein
MVGLQKVVEIDKWKERHPVPGGNKDTLLPLF